MTEPPLPPLLRFGEVAPGQWIDDLNGLRRWEGIRRWRSRHGQAIVTWSYAQAWSISGAQSRDGDTDCEKTVDFGWRRLSPDGRSWVYGDVTIAPETVVFSDGAKMNYDMSAAGGTPGPIHSMMCDAALMADLQDDQLSLAFYNTLLNADLTSLSGLVWSCGDRQAARITALLRNRGESYTDFYLGYMDGCPTAVRTARIAAAGRHIVHMIRMVIPDVALDIDDPASAYAVFAARMPSKMSDDNILVRDIRRWPTTLASLSADAGAFDRIDAHLRRLGWARSAD